MSRGHRIDAIAECVAQARGHRIRLRFASEQAGIAAPEREQAARVAADFVPGDDRLAFRPAAAAGGQQTAEVRIAVPILREQDDRGRSGVVFHGDLRANQQVHAEFHRFDMRAHDAVHAVAIRERKRRQVQRLRARDQFFRMTGAFEKRAVALAPQRDIERRGHSTAPCRNTRFFRWS